MPRTHDAHTLVDMVDTHLSPTSSGDARAAIVASLSDSLAKLPDTQVNAVEDPAALGQLMARLVPPTPGEFADLIGPVYSTKALESLWGITRAGVSKKARTGQLLALKVDGQNVFPLFQFDGARVRTEVVGTARLMQERGADAWSVAAWLCTPLADDGQGRTPLDLLSAGDVAAVQGHARATAERWAA